MSHFPVEVLIPKWLSSPFDQNYPNPFNSRTIIRFALTEPDWVTLKVFNILGREVKTLVQTHLPAGVFQISFESGGLASGTYFYTLSKPGSNLTKKLLLIK